MPSFLLLTSIKLRIYSIFAVQFFKEKHSKMANHKSSEKRIRQTDKKRVHNRYYAKTSRNAIKELRTAKDKKAAEQLLPKVSSMLDKLAKKNVIHKKKASNLKSKLTKRVNALK
jgi:small subunit ribosomal protein S20